MAAALQHIENHWNSTVVPSILEQYKDSEKWQAMLKAVIDQMQIAEDAAAEFMTVLDFNSETPTGYRLDFIAGLVNVTRMAGETDEMFFTRFVTSLGYRRAGTPDFVINSAKFLSQDPHPQYMDEAPATFFVYDGPVYEHRGDGDDVLVKEPGVKQLSRAQVRKLAPAGVLGLPGAAIQLADGTLLCTEDHKLILVVADDAKIEREVLLADNLGNIVITPNSVPVRVKLTGPSVPSIPVIETEWNGVPVDAVRIKDLPDGGDVNSYMVRDSDTEGTVKSRAMDEATLDELWNSTPAEGE